MLTVFITTEFQLKISKIYLHQYSLEMKKKEIIPLCEPNLAGGKEKKYLLNCIKTNYVSTVGNYVGKFEKKNWWFFKSRYFYHVIAAHPPSI